MEVRMIDANALQRKICGAKCGCEHEECGCEHDCDFEHFIFWQPTIDPETLPIVQELRKVVARLVEARENANEACSKYEFRCKGLEKQLEEARRDCAVAEKNHAECVEQLSKVTVERDTLLRERKCLEDTEPVKHAKWEWYPDRKDRQELLCTNCEFEAPYDYQGKYMFTKYCPYCGAKMDLKEKQNVHENPNN